MSPSSPASPGLIGNTRDGYRLAVVHWRQLLAVLLPVMAAALTGTGLLDLLLGRDQMTIINGAPVIHGDGGEFLAWAKLGLAAAFWLLALSAATLVATGAARGHSVRPHTAILAAAKHFPLFAAGACAVVGSTLLLLRVVGGLAGSEPGVVVILGTLAAAGVVPARMLVGLISHQLDGSAWRLTRGRVTKTAGAFLLGGVAIPLLLAYVRDQLQPVMTQPVAAQVIDVVLLTWVIAAQAGILAHVYLLQRDVTQAGDQESADLPAVDARLAELSGPPRRLWPAVAAMVVAVLAPFGVAAANPFGVPTVRSHTDTPGGASAVAWPVGKHPVIATISGARFCDDDACDRYVEPNGGPAVMDGHGAAGISADGTTVVKATLTGGQDNGGPFIDYAKCTRAGCREAWLPVRSSAKEPFGWPDLAAAVAPDQALWFALAMPSADDRPGRATYRLTFIRCADVGCAKPQRLPAGVVERIPDDTTTDQQRIHLSIDTGDRPVATIRTGAEAVTVTCDPATCAAPTSKWAFAGQPGTVWAAPATPAEQVISLEPGTLKIGGQALSLDGSEVASLSGAVAVAGSHVYVTAAEATWKPGLHITVGEPAEEKEPTYWQQVLWRCDQSHCQRQTLDAYESAVGLEMLAASSDGRILVVRRDSILLIAAPETS